MASRQIDVGFSRAPHRGRRSSIGLRRATLASVCSLLFLLCLTLTEAKGDSRIEVYEAGSTTTRELARKAVVALINATSLSPGSSNGTWRISTGRPTLDDTHTLCNDQAFREQPVAADCTGVLVGEDRVLTAGSCISSVTACSQLRFVFGYLYDDETSAAGADLAEFEANDVYSCRRFRSVRGASAGADWTMVQLDRPVDASKSPATVARDLPEPPFGGGLELGNSEEAIYESLVVVGSSSGLPLKVQEGAGVEAVGLLSHGLQVQMGHFAGNGAGVFTANGSLAGIVVRSSAVYLQQGQCFVASPPGQEDTTFAWHANDQSPDCGGIGGKAEGICPGGQRCLASGCAVDSGEGCSGFCDYYDTELAWTISGCTCKTSWGSYGNGERCSAAAADGSTYSGCGMSPPCDNDDGGVAGNSWCVVEPGCESGLTKAATGDGDGSTAIVDYCTPTLHGPTGMHGRLDAPLLLTATTEATNERIKSINDGGLGNQSFVMVDRGSEFDHVGGMWRASEDGVYIVSSTARLSVGRVQGTLEYTPTNEAIISREGAWLALVHTTEWANGAQVDVESWLEPTSGADYASTALLARTSTGAAVTPSLSYQLEVPSTGTYEVSVLVSHHNSYKPSTKVRYTLTHAVGQWVSHIDQTATPGWKSLGVFQFEESGSGDDAGATHKPATLVVSSEYASDWVVADLVRLERVAEQGLRANVNGLPANHVAAHTSMHSNTSTTLAIMSMIRLGAGDTLTVDALSDAPWGTHVEAEGSTLSVSYLGREPAGVMALVGTDFVTRQVAGRQQLFLGGALASDPVCYHGSEECLRVESLFGRGYCCPCPADESSPDYSSLCPTACRELPQDCRDRAKCPGACLPSGTSDPTPGLATFGGGFDADAGALTVSEEGTYILSATLHVAYAATGDEVVVQVLIDGRVAASMAQVAVGPAMFSLTASVATQLKVGQVVTAAVMSEHSVVTVLATSSLSAWHTTVFASRSAARHLAAPSDVVIDAATETASGESGIGLLDFSATERARVALLPNKPDLDKALVDPLGTVDSDGTALIAGATGTFAVSAALAVSIVGGGEVTGEPAAGVVSMTLAINGQPRVDLPECWASIIPGGDAVPMRLAAVVRLAKGDAVQLRFEIEGNGVASSSDGGATIRLSELGGASLVYLPPPAGLESLVVRSGNNFAKNTSVELEQGVLDYDVAVVASTSKLQIVPSVTDTKGVSEVHVAAASIEETKEAGQRVVMLADDQGTVQLMPPKPSNVFPSSHGNASAFASVQVSVFEATRTTTYHVHVERQCNAAAQDRDALLAACERTQVFGMAPETGWCDEAFCVCWWEGVACSDDGEVVEIDLQHQSLTGTIPSELAALSGLQRVVLSHNFLHGTIPPSLGSLRALERLEVGNNFLEGDLPATLIAASSRGNVTVDCALNVMSSEACGLRRGTRDLHQNIVHVKDLGVDWESNPGTSLQPQLAASYWKDGPLVYLDGVLRVSANLTDRLPSTLFQLPPGFAPLRTQTFLTTSAPNDADRIAGVAAITVTSDGLVQLSELSEPVESLSIRARFTWSRHDREVVDDRGLKIGVHDVFSSDGLRIAAGVTQDTANPIAFYYDDMTGLFHLRGIANVTGAAAGDCARSEGCKIASGLPVPPTFWDDAHLLQASDAEGRVQRVVVSPQGDLTLFSHQDTDARVFLDGIILCPTEVSVGGRGGSGDSTTTVVHLEAEHPWYLDGEESPLRVAATADGMVCLGGAVMNPSDLAEYFVIATLPPGFRPERRLKHAIYCEVVAADGEVSWEGNWGGDDEAIPARSALYIEPTGEVSILMDSIKEDRLLPYTPERPHIFSLAGICFGGYSSGAEVVIDAGASIDLHGQSSLTVGNEGGGG